MENRQRKICTLIPLIGLLIFFHVCDGIALGSSISLDVKDSVIHLKAENVPLIDILRAISGKTGLSIKLDETMTERLSCEFVGISLEKVIQQLLKNRSYAMGYKKTGDGRFVPSEVWIVPENNARVFNQMPPYEDAVKNYQKNLFVREFGGMDRLDDFISADPFPVKHDGSGILITKVAEGSPFQKIGLKEGDLIYYANGKPIKAIDDFMEILKSVSSTEQNHIMIGREREDNSGGPIYIHLH